MLLLGECLLYIEIFCWFVVWFGIIDLVVFASDEELFRVVFGDEICGVLGVMLDLLWERGF